MPLQKDGVQFLWEAESHRNTSDGAECQGMDELASGLPYGNRAMQHDASRSGSRNKEMGPTPMREGVQIVKAFGRRIAPGSGYCIIPTTQLLLVLA